MQAMSIRGKVFTGQMPFYQQTNCIIAQSKR